MRTSTSKSLGGYSYDDERIKTWNIHIHTKEGETILELSEEEYEQVRAFVEKH